MTGITFTQFMFPNGARESVVIERPDDVATKAKALVAAGFSLEIENNNGVVWMSCVDHNAKVTRAVDEMCQNGPKVPEMVDKLISRGYKHFVENKRENAIT